VAGGFLDGWEPSVDLLRRLVMAPGVSGWEEPVRTVIEGLVKPYGRVERDRVGNLLLHVGGSGPRLVVAAHMDELGLLVASILDDGLLTFQKIGGISELVLASSHVTVHTREGPLDGVIGVEPPHIRRALGRGGDDKPPRWYEMRIDVGAQSRDEALSLGVRPLDPVTFRKHFTLPARGRYVSTRGLDDRAGSAALVELASLISQGMVEPRAELVLAWTVQEEVGLRGAMAIAHRLEADAMIAVDTMTCCHPVATGMVRLGGGPALRMFDNYYIGHAGLARQVMEAVEARGVPLQLAVAGGGTDAGAFQHVGVPSVAITLPTRYTHSHVEMASLRDYRDLVRALAAVVEHGLEG